MQPVQYTCYSKNAIENFTTDTKSNNLKTANVLLSEVQTQNENTQSKIKLLSEALVAAEHDSEWTIGKFFNYLANENIYTILLVIIIVLVLIIF